MPRSPKADPAVITLGQILSESAIDIFGLKFDQVSMIQNFFPLSLTTRPNKLEGLPLNTLSSQVFEFEGKARANPIGVPFRCSFLGKLLVLPANIRLDWKVIFRYKHSSLFGLIISNEEKKVL